jgi:hypothetical protein
MHIELSFHHVSRDSRIDKTIASNVRKLEKLLSRFSPDLVRLHGQLEFNAPHQGAVCSLNLWLPTGTLSFRHEGDTHLTAVQDCFKHLIEQVKKHKAFVRREGAWQREAPVKKRVANTRPRVKAKSRARSKAAARADAAQAD